MMRTTLVFFFLSLAACDAPSERAPGQFPITRAELELSGPADSQAEADYRQTCLHCHGVDGRGGGGVTAADFTSPAGPLTRRDDVLMASVRDGVRGSVGVMPPHRDLLDDERIRGVVAYVRERYGAGIAVADEPGDSETVGTVVEGAEAD
jgi:mono/diheme cytochrome c family protein